MLHVTFTPSGAGILHQALRQQLGEAARGDRVVALHDPLCVGPIDPPDSARRLAWMRERLGFLPAEWDGLADSTMRFWDESLAAENPIVWTSRCSAAEYCGFMEWAARRGDAPYRLVDVTDVTLVSPGGKPRPLRSISMVRPDLLEVATLITSARSPTRGERQMITHRWETLRLEGANLRVIEDGQIVSAPDDYFDPLLLARVSNDWVNAGRVAAEAMAYADPTTNPGASCPFRRAGA